MIEEQPVDKVAEDAKVQESAPEAATKDISIEKVPEVLFSMTSRI